MVLGATIVVVGSSMAWLRTGARTRSSYEVFAIVDRLGFAPHGPIGWAVRLWPLVPLLVTVTAVLAWQRWSWALLGAAAVAGAYAGGVATAVATAGSRGPLRIEAGPTVTAAGAAVVVAGAICTSFATFRGHGDS